jgi:hypothetical protein
MGVSWSDKAEADLESINPSQKTSSGAMPK